MARLSRVEQQQRNRARVLAAARLEFAEHGYAATKVDAIAERAELTRGAVYSNFPGKRALYFAVLAELLAQWPEPSTGPADRAGGPATAAQAYVRGWWGRPTVTGEPTPSGGGLGFALLAEVAADEATRSAFAGLARLNAILLGLGLERLDSSPNPRRRVRSAEAILTMLYGAEQLSDAAPGFVDPFDLVEAAGRLADPALPDEWAPPHLTYAPAATEVDREWPGPVGQDLVTAQPVRLADDDGVVLVLGLRRLAAAEEAIRAVPPEAAVTVLAVTGQPAELEPLARLTLTEGCGCLRRALPASDLPGVRVLLDAGGTIASAAGVHQVDDDTEYAIRVRRERIIAAADGRGAGHAVASHVRPDGTRPSAPRRQPR